MNKLCKYFSILFLINLVCISQSHNLKKLYGFSGETSFSREYFQIYNSTFLNNSSVESSNDIVDITPRSSEGVSMAAAITLDLVVPGGGHFYLGHIGYGTGFLFLKAASIYLIYHFFRE